MLRYDQLGARSVSPEGRISVAGQAYCTSCGARFDTDGDFCTVCGAGRTGHPAPSTAPLGRAAHTVQSAATVASRATAVRSLAQGLPWATVRGTPAPDVGELLRRAAPLVASSMPRPDLRRPALSILVTLACDLGIALLRIGSTSWPLLALRLATGSSTALLGAASGRSGGGPRKLTGMVSVAFGVVQLVSLASSVRDASDSTAGLATLAPPIVAVASGLLLAAASAIGAWRE